MIAYISLSIAFLASALTCPWWLTVMLGIALLALFEASGIVVAGGVLVDTAFGAPLAPLGGFQYLYTALFVMLALLSWYLHLTLSE